MGVTARRTWIAAAALWGFSEATFFFIVPDVLLTAGVLIFGFAAAFRLSLVAAAGAVAGGLLMYAFGHGDAAAAREFVGAVPLIGDDLMARVQGEIAGAWPVKLTIGAVTGAPYKIYAVESGAAGFSVVAFAVVSFVARLLRFLFAISIAKGVFALAEQVGLSRWRGPGLAFAWTALYAIYASWRLSIS